MPSGGSASRSRSGGLGDHQRLLGLGRETGGPEPLPQIDRQVVAVQLPLELEAQPGEVRDLLGDHRVRVRLGQVGPHHPVPAARRGDLAHHPADPLDARVEPVGPGAFTHVAVEESEHPGMIHGLTPASRGAGDNSFTRGRPALPPRGTRRRFADRRCDPGEPGPGSAALDRAPADHGRPRHRGRRPSACLSGSAGAYLGRCGDHSQAASSEHGRCATPRTPGWAPGADRVRRPVAATVLVAGRVGGSRCAGAGADVQRGRAGSGGGRPCARAGSGGAGLRLHGRGA